MLVDPDRSVVSVILPPAAIKRPRPARFRPTQKTRAVSAPARTRLLRVRLFCPGPAGGSRAALYHPAADFPPRSSSGQTCARRAAGRGGESAPARGAPHSYRPAVLAHHPGHASRVATFRWANKAAARPSPWDSSAGSVALRPGRNSALAAAQLASAASYRLALSSR